MRSIMIVACLAVLAGCATPRPEVMSRTETYAPTITVEIVLETPVRAHKVFALLEDRGGGTPEEINARLIDVGREIGADAIVITEVKNESTTEWIMVGAGYYSRRGSVGMGYQPIQYNYRAVRAKALKYTDRPQS